MSGRDLSTRATPCCLPRFALAGGLNESRTRTMWDAGMDQISTRVCWILEQLLLPHKKAYIKPVVNKGSDEPRNYSRFLRNSILKWIVSFLKKCSSEHRVPSGVLKTLASLSGQSCGSSRSCTLWVVHVTGTNHTWTAQAFTIPQSLYTLTHTEVAVTKTSLNRKMPCSYSLS